MFPTHARRRDRSVNQWSSSSGGGVSGAHEMGSNSGHGSPHNPSTGSNYTPNTGPTGPSYGQRYSGSASSSAASPSAPYPAWTPPTHQSSGGYYGNTHSTPVDDTQHSYHSLESSGNAAERYPYQSNRYDSDVSSGYPAEHQSDSGYRHSHDQYDQSEHTHNTSDDYPYQSDKNEYHRSPEYNYEATQQYDYQHNDGVTTYDTNPRPHYDETECGQQHLSDDQHYERDSYNPEPRETAGFVVPSRSWAPPDQQYRQQQQPVKPRSSGPFPGQPGYKWTPPAAVQAFQEFTDYDAPVTSGRSDAGSVGSTHHKSQADSPQHHGLSSTALAAAAAADGADYSMRTNGHGYAEPAEHAPYDPQAAEQRWKPPSANDHVYAEPTERAPYDPQATEQRWKPPSASDHSYAEPTERAPYDPQATEQRWKPPSANDHGYAEPTERAPYDPQATEQRWKPPSSNPVVHAQLEETSSHYQIPHSEPYYMSGQPLNIPPSKREGTLPADGAFIEWAKMQPTQEVVRRMEQQGIKADTGTDKAGNTLMHGACETGNLSLVFLLYELYPATQLSVTNNSGLLPVHIACQKGMIHIVKFILDNKHADASVTTRDGRTCLHLAAQNNHIELVTYLVEVMPHEALWKTESCGLSALHVACMENHVEVVKALTRAPGADLSLTDSRGRTSLDIACDGGHLSLVKEILSLADGLRPDLTTHSGTNGYTCLHWACANHQYAVIKHLVQEERVNTSARDTNGLTPDKVVDDAVVSFLVTGSSVHIQGPSSSRNDQSESPSVAPWAGVSLRKSGRSVNEEASQATPEPAPKCSSSPSRFKNKPYVPPTNPTFLPPKPADEAKLAASRERSLSKMKAKEQVDVPGKRWDCHGFQSHSAGAASEPVKSGVGQPTEKPPVKRLSIDKDNWIKPSEDDVPKYKGENDAREVIRAAVENDSQSSDEESADSNPVPATTIAAAKQDESVLFDWVKLDSKVAELENFLGITPNIKVDVNKISDGDTGDSLLHVACVSGHLAIAQLLVEGVGSDVNRVNNEGKTSLHCAIASERVLIVRYLVKYCGAALDIKDKSGKTALDLCNEMPRNSNTEEITRIVSKAQGKSVEKRTKINLPVFG